MASFKSISIPAKLDPDERQRQAIEHPHGPMLVIAGAGTGKTTVLTRRIARLIQENHARPDEILALTYTDNAAKEMRERVQVEAGRKLSGMQVETFHAYCNKLLIDNGRQFGVLDEKDLWIYLRKRIRELQLRYFVRAANIGQFLNDLLEFMRRCQDELVGPEKYAGYVRRLERGELPIPRVCKSKDVDALTDEEVLGRCREIAGVFTKAEQMLAVDGLGTFGHMITGAYELLKSNPQLLAGERERARFILVDEFQDANFAQVKILQSLAGEDRNIFAVGDPDQAIYRFRGASSAAFALFQHAFPGARIVALEKNRRSTTPILKTAHTLIAKNPEVFSGKAGLNYRRAPLVSAREEDALKQGRPLQPAPVETVLFGAQGKDLESSDAATIIRQLHRQSRCKWKDIAVLYRLHLHRDELVKELSEQGIPYAIDNMDVTDTPEARDLFACLGALISSADDASLLRVAALPQFAVNGEELRAAIKALPREQESGGVAVVLGKIQGGRSVLQCLQEARDEIERTSVKSRAALDILVRRFGLDRRSPALTAVLEFVSKWEEKPKAITASGRAAELLDYLEYLREAGGAIPMASTDRDAVQLMTAHAAKGLEFDHVIILRANSGQFPASYRESLVEFPRELRDPDSLAREDDKTLHQEEERRLFYVAMTRARDSLTIYAKRGTGNDTTPAGFMRELLKDRSLNPYLQQRPARALQVDLFGQAVTPSIPRTEAWLKMPPASDLSARLSASAVQAYENCPLQFKLDRDWRIPGEPPAAMQYGASIHRVLRAYYDSVRFGRPLSDEELLELFRTDLGAAKIQDSYQRDLYQKLGTEQLREFLAAVRHRPAPEVLHTEEHFEVKIGETAVTGRIDRVDKLPDGRVVITDYKTGKPQSQEDADESLQLSIYALAAWEKWKYRVDHLVFHNLDGNGAVLTRRADTDLQGAKTRIEKVARSIAGGDFDAKPSFAICRSCAYRNLCPATEKRFSTKGADSHC